MKLKYILNAFTILLLIALASCDDQLDLSPISSETQDNAYASESQIEAALTGVYESFQSSDYYVWDNVIFQDIKSDNYYAGGDNSEIYEVEELNVRTTNTRIFGAWSTIYNAIAKANVVLKYVGEIEDINFTDERRAQVEGEARFLRAYHYFNLVKMFGGVPIILEPITSTDASDTQLPRNTEEEVYSAIIDDLEQAIELLPSTYGDDASVNKARATKGAANGLLAKVYLQMPSPDYDKAITYADAVINDTEAGYVLLDDYSYLFDGNHYNNDESIMEVQWTGGDEGNWAPQMHLPPSISGDTWRKFTVPSHDLIDAFDAEGDEIRKEASVIYESAPWVDEYWNNSINSEIPFAYKWKNAMSYASTDREYILRLGDIILIKAEALNNNGAPEQAAELVDQIRERVGLDPLSDDVRTDQSAMKTAILHERRLELAQEAQRWDDLVRNDVAIETMNNLQEVNLNTGEVVDYNATEADILMPIPQQEINRNPNLEQNPL